MPYMKQMKKKKQFVIHKIQSGGQEPIFYWLTVTMLDILSIIVQVSSMSTQKDMTIFNLNNGYAFWS